MGYADGVLVSAYAALFLTAVPTALLLRTAVMLVVRRSAPQRTRDRRLTLVFIYAAFVVGTLAVIVIVHGIEAVIAGEALVFLASSVVVLSTAFIFWRAVGIPLLFIASVLLVIGAYMTRPWQPVAAQGTSELATVMVLSSVNDTMSFEISPYPTEPTGENVLQLSGSAFSVTVELVDYHPYWFFLGRRMGARVDTIVAQEKDGTAGGATDTAVLPDPCDDALCRLIHARVEGFPGIEVLKRETRVVEAETLIEYAVLITDAGEVRLEAR